MFQSERLKYNFVCQLGNVATLIDQYPGGYSQKKKKKKKKLGGGVQPTSQKHYPIKICDTPYPINDLTNNFKLYDIKILLQTRVVISFLVQPMLN